MPKCSRTCKRAILHQIRSNLIFINRNNTEVRYRCSNFGFVKLAMTISPSVRIILPSHNPPSLQYIFKGSVHQPTIAAPVTSTIFFWITLQTKKKKKLYALDNWSSNKWSTFFRHHNRNKRMMQATSVCIRSYSEPYKQL